GQYGVVTLRARSKVTFTKSTTGSLLFQMTQLIIEPDVQLTFDQSAGPLDIRVQTTLSVGDRVTVKPGATTAPGALAQLYAAQSQPEMTMGNESPLFPVALTAPSGNVHVGSRTNLVGSIQAKTIVVDPDTGVARVPADDWLGTGASGLEFLGYPTGAALSVA